jgi:putative glutamine amidotransferase
MDELKVGIATVPFFAHFKSYFPNLVVIGKNLAILPRLDLVIFPGGADISPRLYNQDFHGARGIEVERDAVELEVFRHAQRLKLKMLGVCRGHQLINALLGGGLVQDIRPGHASHHEVVWLKKTPVQQIYTDNVNSMHHQGYTADEISKHLEPFAIEPESRIVELAYSRDNRILTTQFHPEFSTMTAGQKFFDYVCDWVKEE